MSFLMFIAASASGDPASHPASVPSKAIEAAKKAELTPIVPSPKDVTKPAYQLYLETDLPILGIVLAVTMARFVTQRPAFCSPLCDPEDLNPLDRVTAGYYDNRWALTSDIGLAAAAVGAAALLTAVEGPLAALNDAVVIAEAALAAQTIASIATFAVARPRPYLYGENAPLEKRSGSDAAMSFLSSHAATTFAIGVSTFMTMLRLDPKKGAVLPWVALGVGLATGAIVATARVMGGRHFITDVIGGAVVGASMGVVIPAIHAAPVRVVPQVSDKGATLGVSGTF